MIRQMRGAIISSQEARCVFERDLIALLVPTAKQGETKRIEFRLRNWL